MSRTATDRYLIPPTATHPSEPPTSGNVFDPTEGFSKSIGSGFRPRMVTLLQRSACLPQDCSLPTKRRDDNRRLLAPGASLSKRREVA